MDTVKKITRTGVEPRGFSKRKTVTADVMEIITDLTKIKKTPTEKQVKNKLQNKGYVLLEPNNGETTQPASSRKSTQVGGSRNRSISVTIDDVLNELNDIIKDVKSRSQSQTSRSSINEKMKKIESFIEMQKVTEPDSVNDLSEETVSIDTFTDEYHKQLDYECVKENEEIDEMSSIQAELFIERFKNPNKFVETDPTNIMDIKFYSDMNDFVRGTLLDAYIQFKIKFNPEQTSTQANMTNVLCELLGINTALIQQKETRTSRVIDTDTMIKYNEYLQYYLYDMHLNNKYPQTDFNITLARIQAELNTNIELQKRIKNVAKKITK